MYRYFLFYCCHYYPSGGMTDCQLKTNDFDELARYIDEHYGDEYDYRFHYYDAVEDKIMYAVMDELDENYCRIYKFAYWSENRE